MLTERHQQPIDVSPLLAGNLLFENFQRLLRLLRRHVAPAVYHAVNVDIDADGGLPGCYTEGEVGTFWPYAFQRCERIEISRESTVKLVDDSFGDAAQGIRFLVGIRGAVEQARERWDVEGEELFGGTGLLKQPQRDWDSGFVERADRNDARNQLLEQAVIAPTGQLEHSGFGVGLNGVFYTGKNNAEVEVWLHVCLNFHNHQFHAPVLGSFFQAFVGVDGPRGAVADGVDSARANAFAN